jgi:diguanylate cyclase (GGDEF)-like protein/PAS domain S-box-containing protein
MMIAHTEIFIPRELPGVQTRGEILVVEDAPASLRLLNDLLSREGYRVRQAPNGELALAMAYACTPELILLDVRMPGIDGFEVCRRLKQSSTLRDVPVIFLSAQHDTDDKVRGFQLGAVDFIAKPFQIEEILARTDVHVRLGRTQQALQAERANLEQRVQERTAQLARTARALEQQIALRRANEASLHLCGEVFEATLDAILVTDRDGLVVMANPAFSRVSGYTQQDLIGWNSARLRHGIEDRAVHQAMWDALHAAGSWSGEITTRHKNGELYPGLLSVSTVRDARGEVLNYVTVFTDLSERKAEQLLIDFLSHHDALTGLPNRLLARRRFEQARTDAGREGCTVAVLCLDLDRFKSINDAAGNTVGDRALQQVAGFLVSCVRESDTVTRQGGDEFQIILQDSAALGATLATAQKILDGLREGLLIEGELIVLTASIGIALWPNDGASFDDLVRDADTALVRAKETGRDCFWFFTERMNTDLREKIAIQTQLRGAIGRNELEVLYQPQMSLVTGALLGAEALLRWHNGVLGQVAPSRFIPLAEECGLITAIGEWVLETVCAQIKLWQDEGLGAIKVAVNLSGRQFEQDSTIAFVERTVSKYGIAADSLELEITEGTVMGDPDKAVEALHRLKQIGVGISLDDFGTGYSSLSYLKRFPIDVLKIDKSFVDDVSTSKNDAAIALSVISLAHNLNMKVIAEGVETRAQVDFLARHGCDEMQGNYFSRAVAAREFGALLREKTRLRDVAPDGHLVDGPGR